MAIPTPHPLNVTTIAARCERRGKRRIIVESGSTTQHRISTYTSPESAFLVNSFLIETATGVVVIDTQFLVSPAKELRDRIAQLGRPLLAVVITHPHPDHFGGTAIILENAPDVPVYALQVTIDGIKQTEASKREFWTPVYGDEYPPTTFLPNKTVNSQEIFEIDDLQLQIDHLGGGESSDNAVVYLSQSKQLIASDLVYNHVHPWLAEGRSQAWLQQLDLVKSRFPQAERVFAGHGNDGTLDLLDQQSAYITTFREMISEGRANGDLSDDVKSDLVTKVKRTYPGYGMENLISFNIDGVAKELESD